MVGMLQFSVGSHDTHNGLFSKNRWQNGHTDIDLTIIQRNAEMSILRQSPLGNVQICQNLDTGDQRCMDISLDIYIFHDRTIDTHTHSGFFFKWLNVDITRTGFDRTLDQTVQKTDDRCFVIAVVQIFDFQFIHRTGCRESDVCLFCRFSGTDFCKIVRNRLFQRCFFTQQNFKLTARLLSYFLQCKIVQRIICHDLHIVVFDIDRQDQILFCQ